MNFLANENFPLPSVRLLRAARYDVRSVVEDIPSVSDSVILALAVRENRIILTFDRDYGELIYKHRQPAPLGIVYFRFIARTPDEPAQRLLQLLSNGTSTTIITLEHRFTVVERDQVRQRIL
jgi:predicted nuclease of predicted toxin-antitoxin system